MPEVETPHGPSRVHLRGVEKPVAGLALGHGAAGGVGTPDLVVATEVANQAGVGVALVEQPYVVAGRRSPAPAKQLDAAWNAVVNELSDGAFEGLPLIVGGRSAGARVACRTAADADAVEVPVLVVQGESDPFGMPADGPGRTVVKVPGNHSLKDTDAVAAAVSDWLPAVLASL